MASLVIPPPILQRTESKGPNRFAPLLFIIDASADFCRIPSHDCVTWNIL